MHNTGARNIGNGFDQPILIIDLEDSKRTITVPARTVKMWDGTIFPWCDNNKEVLEKAFLVRDAVTNRILYWLFQVWSQDQLAYFRRPDIHNLIILDPYDKRLSVGTSMTVEAVLPPVPNADVFIMKSHIWGMPAGNSEPGAQGGLNDALKLQ